MHRFLRAAGFSDFTTEESVYNLIRQHVVRPHLLSARLDLEDGCSVLEYRLPVNEHVGICAALLDLGGGSLTIRTALDGSDSRVVNGTLVQTRPQQGMVFIIK